jgi:hypothetical protein
VHFRRAAGRDHAPRQRRRDEAVEDEGEGPGARAEQERRARHLAERRHAGGEQSDGAGGPEGPEQRPGEDQGVHPLPVRDVANLLREGAEELVAPDRAEGGADPRVPSAGAEEDEASGEQERSRKEGVEP